MRRARPDTLRVVADGGPRQRHGAIERTTLQRRRKPHLESIGQAERSPRDARFLATLDHGVTLRH